MNCWDLMMTKKRSKLSSKLYTLVKQKINFADFLETEIGCKLRWYDNKISAGTVCPLPNHRDNKPSFRIKYMEDSQVYIFHCFGCNSKGTIIDFCTAYYGLNDSEEAVEFLCKKFNIDKDNPEIQAIADTKKEVNLRKKVEHAHIITANQCRLLLQKNYIKYNKWIGKAYKRLNKALDEGKMEEVENIGYEAHNMLGE
jgi:DNA primase